MLLIGRSSFAQEIFFFEDEDKRRRRPASVIKAAITGCVSSESGYLERGNNKLSLFLPPSLMMGTLLAVLLLRLL